MDKSSRGKRQFFIRGIKLKRSDTSMKNDTQKSPSPNQEKSTGRAARPVKFNSEYLTEEEMEIVSRTIRQMENGISEIERKVEEKGKTKYVRVTQREIVERLHPIFSSEAVLSKIINPRGKDKRKLNLEQAVALSIFYGFDMKKFIDEARQEVANCGKAFRDKNK